MKKRNRWLAFVVFLFVVVLIEMLFLKTFHDDSFGIDRNSIREVYNVPIVPQNWRCNRISDEFILCTGEDTVGYLGKEIKLEGGKVLFEKDTYLSPCRKDSSLRIIVESYFQPIFNQDIWRKRTLNSREEINRDSFMVLSSEWKTCDLLSNG